MVKAEGESNKISLLTGTAPGWGSFTDSSRVRGLGWRTPKGHIQEKRRVAEKGRKRRSLKMQGDASSQIEEDNP